MNHGLRIESLTVRIPLLGGSVVHAASDIDLDVPAGAVTALVGESGCGKSIIATSVMNMLPPNASRTGTVTVGTPEPLPDREPEDVRPLAQFITTYPDTFQVERLDLGIGALGPQFAEVTRYIDSQLQLRRITALRLSGRTA